MARIVTTAYRYRPPPKRKGRKLAEITGPVIITVGARKTVPRQREGHQQMARIVTYVPKRQQDAWTRYLRLTGLTDPDAPQPP